MYTTSCLRSEDQFLCSICLDVFKDPVTTPCGHNFCKSCISEHWEANDICQCPLCSKVFYSRPELDINTFISEMAAQFRLEVQQKPSSSSSSSSEQEAAKPGDVSCDVCAGTRLMALKSCLDCLMSFCEAHLQPHLTAARLKRHKLISPMENLEGRMCVKHDKPLELFCKRDQTCICMFCSVSDHKTHDVVPLKEEYEGKKAELVKTEAELQQMILMRRLKIQDIKQSVKISKEDANREKVEGVQVFTALKESIKRGLNELIKEIEQKEQILQKQAEDFVKELEQEIYQLTRKTSELEQLSHAEDHLHIIQSFPFLKAAPPTKDWTEVRLHCPSYEGSVMRAVGQLEETVSKEIKKVFEAELTRIQQFAVDVTLDPDTAHPDLVLSDDGKQVHDSNTKRNLPDSPERFSDCNCVLAKQSFSSGRFYFEVQVKDKTDWDVGVARESINRKESVPLSPQEGYWAMWLRNGNEYEALDEPPVALFLKSKLETVGVFVDYHEGLVSFYDADAAALIYSFTGCCFTERLYPYFCPSDNDDGNNSAPLVICTVKQTNPFLV